MKHIIIVFIISTLTGCTTKIEQTYPPDNGEFIHPWMGLRKIIDLYDASGKPLGIRVSTEGDIHGVKLLDKQRNFKEISEIEVKNDKE